MQKKNIVLFSLLFIIEILVMGCESKSDQVETKILPHPDHIVIVVEENHAYEDIIGSEYAPFINDLANKSALFNESYGTTHPSQPNYLALFSGSELGVDHNNCLTEESPFDTPNLAATLIEEGFTFKGYAQTMPSVGYMGCSFGNSDLTQGNLYVRKHAPWVNWIGNGPNNISDTLSLPMSKFPTDFSQLPTVSFVIPDQDYDMHNSGILGDSAAIKRGDEWLKNHLESYIQWAETHNSILILTFDEDDSHNENHIVTLFFGPMINPGNYTERIDHYDVFKTIGKLFELPISETSNGRVIKNIWK